MKYLPLYYKWIKKGLPEDGLCNSLPENDALFQLMTPLDEYKYLAYWGFNGEMRYRRSYGLAINEEIWNSFTPLRQNIILFMAALNGEL